MHGGSIYEELQKIRACLNDLLRNDHIILRRLENMSTNVTSIDQATLDLAAAVSSETTVEQSAITLINSLLAQLSAANASGDAVQVETLIQQIKASSTALAAAVAANTVASPAAAAVATANLTPAAAALIQKVADAPSNQAPVADPAAPATT